MRTIGPDHALRAEGDRFRRARLRTGDGWRNRGFRGGHVMTAFTEVGTFLETKNSNGLTIRGVLETPATGDDSAPLAIVAPSYALSMRHFGPLSLFLTLNGFRVLRFDYTNH